MPLAQSDILAAASVLADRRRNGTQGARLPETCRPNDIDDALAIQAAVTARLGEHIGGWKCATPSDGRIILAPIRAGTIHAASPCIAWARGGQVRVEPELAFILGKDLPARDQPYQPAEVDAAIGATHLALELIDSRYGDQRDPTYPEHLADGLLNQGLFLGPQVDGIQAEAAGTLAISATPETGKKIQVDGRHPDGQPRAPLYWLAEYLRARGQGLQTGQVVITGSYAGSFDLPADQDVVIRFGTLGELRLRLAGK